MKSVYFIKPINMDGPIKIGCANVPVARLQYYMIWSPFPLEVAVSYPGDFGLERDLHDCFADAHLHHEWFQAVPALVAGIEALKAGVSVEAAFDLKDRRGSVRKTSSRWSAHMLCGLTWQNRLIWARKRASKETGEKFWIPPEVLHLVKQIKAGEAFPLTEAQEALLEAICAHPARHMLTETERWPVESPAFSPRRVASKSPCSLEAALSPTGAASLISERTA